MRKKPLFIILGIIVVFVTTIIILSNINNNSVLYYTANVTIDEFGNASVEETVVINYKSYDNYLFRDVKYNKNHQNNPLFKDVDYNKYKDDQASFDDSSVDVEVWRGNIIDELETAKEITDDVKIGYSFNNDLDKNGKAIECYPSTPRCESIYVDATDCGSLDGVMSFVYRYTLNGMVTVYNDCAELNYLLFEYFNYKVKVAAVTFTLPNNNLSEDKFHGYGHGLSNGRIIQNGNQGFDYIAKNVSTEEAFECRIVFPKEIVGSVNSNNVVNSDMYNKVLDYETNLAEETNKRVNIAITINCFTAVVIAAMIFITIVVYRKFDKEHEPEFDLDYLREMPSKDTPAEVGFLYYFGQTKDEVVTATLLDLVRRRFLTLQYLGSPTDEDLKYIISKNIDKLNSDGHELKQHERQIIKWFIDVIGDGKQVSNEQIESYGKGYSEAQKFQNNAQTFVQDVKKVCESKDWMVNSSKKSIAFAALCIPVLFLIIINLISVNQNIEFTWNNIALTFISIGYLFYVATIKKRTVAGNELFAKWQAFKRFLEEFGNFEDYPMPGIVVWEEFLVYATVFKIADKVMDQLTVKLPELETQSEFSTSSYLFVYHTGGYGRFNIASSMNRAMNNARSNSINSIAAHNAKASGGGHGGGFTGGSSFGGGGGGFRGGR